MVQREKLEELKELQVLVLDLVHRREYHNVHELVNEIRNSNDQITIEQIKEAIEWLQDEGKIMLTESQFEASFPNYLRDYSCNLPFWLGLAAISVSLLIHLITPITDPFLPVLAIVGTAITFFLPGYGLLGLLFPQKDLSMIERVGISIVMSLALLLVLWLVLDRTLVATQASAILISTHILSGTLILGSAYREFLVRASPTPAKLGK
jgi:hypothetical protein